MQRELINEPSEKTCVWIRSLVLVIALIPLIAGCTLGKLSMEDVDVHPWKAPLEKSVP
jgi:hypothetical protein